MPAIQRNLTIGFITVWVLLFLAALTAWEVLTGGASRDLLIGTWIGAFASAVQYHIGSSRGSERKTELMAAAAQAPAEPPAPEAPNPPPVKE